MISRNYQGVTALRDVGITHTELMNAVIVMPFLLHYIVSHQGHP